MERLSGWIAFTIIAGVVGCDQAPPPPPAVPTPTAQNPGPTTRDLLSGPRKALKLAGYPLTMEVPASWQINTPGSVTFLEGPTPSGPAGTERVIHILVSRHPAYTPEMLKGLEDAQAKASGNENVRLSQFRAANRVRVFERRIVQPPAGELPAMMSWIIVFYVPQGEQYIPYELNFIDLPLETYEKDKEFLEKILDSAKVDA